MLEAHGLDAFYGSIQVLWGVSFTVEPGQMVAVIGPNGAGKSSLLRAVMGLLTVRPRGPGPGP